MVTGVLHFKQFKVANRGAVALAKAHLKRQVPDPELREKLTPDYDFGCKRPTFSNEYFASFTKPNVALQTSSIVKIDPDGIITADGEKVQIDTLVLATGFDLWDTNFPAFEIRGRDGMDLGSGGAPRGSKLTRESLCRSSRTSSPSTARTPTAASRTSRRSRGRCATSPGCSAKRSVARPRGSR